MYKITLYDYNLPPFVSGTAEFYTEDIQKFRREWLELEDNKNRIDRFLRSLNGEIVTDYYSDDAELNIVQEDKKARIFGEEEICYKDKVFTLENGYSWTGRIKVKTASFHIKRFQFRRQYVIAGCYKLSGVAEERDVDYYDRQEVYGNPVLRTEYYSRNPYDSYRSIQDKELQDFRDFSNFERDTIESICYIVLKEFRSLEEMQRYQIKKRDLENMMRDILGEAG